MTDPTGAAQEAAASGEGGSDAPAVVWRTYPEEWIVATKPKIGPPRQVCGVVSARVVSEMGNSVWCLSAHRAPTPTPLHQISSMAERPSQEVIEAALKEASEGGGGLLDSIGLGNVF